MLFNELKQKEEGIKIERQLAKEYKNDLLNEATAIRQLMNLSQIYKSSKSKQRKDFERDVNGIKAYQNDVKDFLYKAYLMNNNVDDLIDKIHGNINLNTFTSSGDYELVDSFIPIHFKIQFVDNHNNGKITTFIITKQDDKTKHTYEEEVEIDGDYRSRPSGDFFPFISEINIDLTDYQIFNIFI